MVGPDRIDGWIDQLKSEHLKNGQELTIDKAKTMLALCACIETAVTGFLIRHQLEERSHGKTKA